MRNVTNLTSHILVAALIGASPLLWYPGVSAAPLTQKAVSIGDSTAAAVTNHRFNFVIGSVSNVGSIEFEYCDNTPFVGTTCDAPAGLNVDSAVLASQSGETGFSVDPVTTSNRIVLTRPAGLTSAVPVTYEFSNITNPSTPNDTTYVRISTFASVDATGARTDEGAVAFSINRAVNVSGYVPPYLRFCVGVVVAPNCISATGVLVNFGELSASQPRSVTSQFGVATNDPGGYSTTVVGSTMTSGSNVIPSITGTPTGSQPGTSQFGMNLRANSNPTVGSNPSGVGSGTISPPYASPNLFYFESGTVASSVVPSDFNVYTVSYLVNINQEQKPGIYSTTLTYIATAAF